MREGLVSAGFWWEGLVSAGFGSFQVVSAGFGSFRFLVITGLAAQSLIWIHIDPCGRSIKVNAELKFG